MKKVLFVDQENSSDFFEFYNFPFFVRCLFQMGKLLFEWLELTNRELLCKIMLKSLYFMLIGTQWFCKVRSWRYLLPFFWRRNYSLRQSFFLDWWWFLWCFWQMSLLKRLLTLWLTFYRFWQNFLFVYSFDWFIFEQSWKRTILMSRRSSQFLWNFWVNLISIISEVESFVVIELRNHSFGRLLIFLSFLEKFFKKV